MIRSEKGQALVETALVIPILLLLIIGIVDLGRGFYTFSAIHFTAQEAARQASFGKTDAEIKQHARDNFRAGDSSKLNAYIETPVAQRVSGSYVTVTVEYPLEPLLPFVSALFNDPILLKTDSTIRME